MPASAARNDDSCLDRPVARPHGHLSLERLRHFANAGIIETVMLAVPDLQGRLKGKRYEALRFLDRVSQEGAEMCAYVLATDVDMTPVHGFALTSWETGYQDLVVVPDLSTLRVVPWVPGTALVLGEAVDRKGEPIEVAPRWMLQRQLSRLADRGLRVKAGLETEFVLYQGTYDQIAERGHQRVHPATAENLDYALDHSAVMDRYFRRLQKALAGAGLPVEAIKTEGALGQVEVTFPYGEALAACDGHLAFKHAARAVGNRAHLAPSFMAAPETGVASGLHLHVSLWRDGKSVLTSSDGELSPVAMNAIGGLLEALPHFGPLFAPNVNSYKRFVPESFAPTSLTWGFDNRTCAVRVVGHGEGRHVEVRVPGADANPYLALAAIVAAVNYGIEHRLAPGLAQTGSAYNTGGAPLPRTLEQAQAALKYSLIAREAFGPDVVTHYAHLAQVEIDHHQRVVTDAERHRWFARA